MTEKGSRFPTESGSPFLSCFMPHAARNFSYCD